MNWAAWVLSVPPPSSVRPFPRARRRHTKEGRSRCCRRRGTLTCGKSSPNPKLFGGNGVAAAVGVVHGGWGTILAVDRQGVRVGLFTCLMVCITLAKEREGGRGCSANHGWLVGWRFGDHEEEKWRRNTRTKMGYKKPHFEIVRDDNTLARETKLIGIS